MNGYINDKAIYIYIYINHDESTTMIQHKIFTT
jgi:hypothetical protein